MIANLIGGFVSILIGVSLIGPLAVTVNDVTTGTNSTGGSCVGFEGDYTQPGCQLTLAASWGATVLKLVPGFFSLGILGIGLAVTYSSLRQAGVL